MEPELLTTLENFSTMYTTWTSADIWLSAYMSDTVPAIMVTNHEGAFPPDDYVAATVNMSGYGIFPAPGNVIIKDYAENEGIRKELERGGVIGPALAVHRAGFASVTEHKLLLSPQDDRAVSA